jgi:hypothetical protein
MRWSAECRSQECRVRRPGGIQGHRNYLAEMPSVTSGSGGLYAADVPLDRTQTAPPNQPGTAGSAHVALRTFEQKNPFCGNRGRATAPGDPVVPEKCHVAATRRLPTLLYARFCGRLEAKFLRPTRQPRTPDRAPFRRPLDPRHCEQVALLVRAARSRRQEALATSVA